MMKLKRILVIKLCCIGDIIFMTPALRRMREQFPDARITFMASRWVKEIIERVPYIDEVIYFDAPFEEGSWLRKIRPTLNIVRELRKGKYDVAVLGHRTSSMPALALLAGVRRRVGFRGTRFLTMSIPFDETSHEADRYLSLAACLDGETQSGQNTTHIVARDSDVEFARKYLAESSVSPDKKFFGIFPGGGENPGTRMMIKRWYPKEYAALVSALFAEMGIVPIFLGGKADENVVKEIIGLLPPDVPFLDAVGSSSLGELCGLLTSCLVVIGGDSGPVHMAAALGVPTVMIFGPSDPRLVAPRGSRHLSVWKHVPCSPCYTPSTALDKSNFVGNSFVCRTKTHECLTLVTVQVVLVSVREVLAARPSAV